MGMETDTDYSNVPNSIDSRQINIKNGDKDIQFHVVNYCSVPLGIFLEKCLMQKITMSMMIALPI